MWKRLAIQAAISVGALLVVAVLVLVYLWRDRPSLDNIAWQPAPEPADGGLSITWLGVTTVLIDDGETQILVDGFFSRPSLADGILGRPVANDAATINYVLHEFRMRRLAAIIPVHSHFDHAMDVGAIAKRTSASVVGSESTANIARGAGVPEDQVIVAADGEVFEFGEFRVRLIESRHGPIGWRGSVPLDGRIDEPLALPAPISSMRVGKTWSVVLEHPGGTILVQGSSGFIEGALTGVHADIALLCTYGLSSLGKEYAQQYWQEMVTTTGARVVVPMHFDDLTRPFGEVVPFPRVLDDIEATSEWFEEFRDTWDVDVRLLKPELGRPIAVYEPPDSST
ncbi:MAG TPA: MBL fold metallo-hydrolase [Woeseiaceae bacterium]|jgi:L-ascorbate metabolism protein UlaG (beta-lactamase superfamily)|nr:MBL fold metallo-hydrolase [Woeseiaceae bacterium]